MLVWILKQYVVLFHIIHSLWPSFANFWLWWFCIILYLLICRLSCSRFFLWIYMHVPEPARIMLRREHWNQWSILGNCQQVSYLLLQLLSEFWSYPGLEPWGNWKTFVWLALEITWIISTELVLISQQFIRRFCLRGSAAMIKWLQNICHTSLTTCSLRTWRNWLFTRMNKSMMHFSHNCMHLDVSWES